MMTAIDVHTHLAPSLDHLPDGGIAPGSRPGPAGLYDPDALEAYLDSAGLDVALVTAPPPFYAQHLDASNSLRWAAAINEGLLARIAGRPRLRPLAYLPLHEPRAALEEYQRIRHSSGWWGVAAGAGGRIPSLADPAFAPLWRELGHDRRTLLLHPAASPDPRLDEFYLSNLLGNPVETAIAVAQLVFGDVIAEYPGMRLILVHGGGVVPAITARWSRGVTTARPGIRELRLSPAEAARRIWADCLTHDPAVTALVTATFGEDKVLLGSDWPFPMGTDDPAATLGGRDSDLARRAATANAAAALGLGASRLDH